MRDYVNSSTNIVFLAGGDERAGFGLIGAMFGAVSLLHTDCPRVQLSALSAKPRPAGSG